MSSTNLESVKKILEEALEIPVTERATYLARACAGDSELKHEVESLLAHEDAEPRWREGPILRASSGNGGAPRLEPDQRIGPYRVLRSLGEGGMGSVALAIREDDFEKKVALKVIRSGLTSKEILHRFHEERQILAQLDHRNIARLLDGGTTPDGHPFYVMEYVDGLPIDEYCARHELSLDQRLKLFLEICSALQLAHRNLIVHRDLKPCNILVTGEGEPKLLDFGIAKRLDAENTDLSGPLRPMTIKYASPEQISGDHPPNTGIDVYSLGVLLYQLLTGEHPHAAYSGEPFELARAIREEDPKTPSAVAHDRRYRARLAGDLDSIVLKAMRKKQNRRYGSVENLADDVQRFRRGDPVEARQGDWRYRAGKFIRHHRRSLTLATALFLIVVISAVSTLVLWRRAEAEREQAEAARQSRDGAIDALGELFVLGADPDEGGDELAIRRILELGERRIEERSEDPLLQAEVLASIGEVYTRIGDYDRAHAPWERAVDRLRQHFPQGHPELAKAINNLAGSYYHASLFEEAEELYVEALEMKRRFSVDHETDVGKSMANLATIYMNRGEYEKAEPLYLEALDVRRENEEPHDAIARSLRSLGVLYYTWGRLDQVEPYLLESLEIRERIFEPENTNIATALTSIGRLRQAQGRFAEAEQLFTRAFDIRSRRFDAKHLHIAWSKLDLARLCLETGELARGEPLATEALEVFREKKGSRSWEVAEAESVLGGYLFRLGKFEEAEDYLSQSYKTLREIRGERSVYARDARRLLEELQAAREGTEGAVPG